MNPLKILAKVTGTVVLTAVGTTCAVFERSGEMSGNYEASEFIGGIKSASFDTIKGFWTKGDSDADIDTADDISGANEEVKQLQKTLQRYNSELASLKRFASAAQQAGNTEKYTEIMENIDSLKERIEDCKREIEDAKYQY